MKVVAKGPKALKGFLVGKGGEFGNVAFGKIVKNGTEQFAFDGSLIAEGTRVGEAEESSSLL